MTTTNQWIPLSGPGGRLPTSNDADSEGYVYAVQKEGFSDRILWEAVTNGYWTHFCPIPKAPPLPKPVEASQEEKDREKADSLFSRGKTTFTADAHEFANWARSDGRAQLAREALGLFQKPSASLDEIANIVADELETTSWARTEKSIRGLHALLTKAEEEKP